MSRPEAAIQRRIRAFLGDRGWETYQTHGNAFQAGLTDLIIYNPKYGYRFVDVKVAGRYSFTKAQCQVWTAWEKVGWGVWILTDDTDEEYKKLFGPPNFRDYWKPSYDRYLATKDEILDQIEMESD